MTLAALILLMLAQAGQVYAVLRLYRENCILREALLTVQRPEVAAVVRKTEQSAAEEPEEPVKRVIFR